MISTVSKIDKKFDFLVFRFFALAIIVIATTVSLEASDKRDTNNNADQNLRGAARVNPSTLAMELTVPFGIYLGRNNEKSPLEINYSSKVWRIDNMTTYWYPLPYSCNRQYVTQTQGRFAERSVAGWNSGVSFPVIEERMDFYNQEGDPYSPNIDEARFNDLFQEALTSNVENQMPSPVSCGMGCTTYGCSPMGWDLYICTCSAWRLFTHGCTEPDTGGGVGGTCPTGGNTPPENMYYIKRVHIRMPDGSSTEFRKSDEIFLHDPNVPLDRYGVYLAVDGSGLRLERSESGSTLFLPNGGRYSFPSTATGAFDGATLYQAFEYSDNDGNRNTYVASPTSGSNVGKVLTTNYGHRVMSPLPENLYEQSQRPGLQEILLPDLGGGGTRKYTLRWQHLKPAICEASTDPDCGNGDGALEDQSQRLYHYSSNICFGSALKLVDPDPNAPTSSPRNRHQNEILFPSNGIGLRSCNPFMIPEGSEGTISNAVALRFNPIVLSEINLPNGGVYKFRYNQFGEITKLTHPSGAVERFEYGYIAPLSYDYTPVYNQSNRGVRTHTISYDGNTIDQTYNYQVARGTVAQSYGTYITNPDGSQKVTAVEGAVRADYGFDNPMTGRPVDERLFTAPDADGNRRLTTRALTKYGTWSLSQSNRQRDPRVDKQISIAFEDNPSFALATMTDYDHDDAAAADPRFFSALNVKLVKHYKAVAVPRAIAESASFDQIAAYFTNNDLTHTEEMTYLYDAAYMERGITGLLQSKVVKDRTGRELVKTETVYDNQTPNSGGVSYPYSSAPESYGIGASYECPAFGTNPATVCWQNPNTTRRGLPTTTRVWDFDSNRWIDTHIAYDIFGNAIRAKDKDNREVTTVYTAQYRYAYPAAVTIPAPDPSGVNGSNQPFTTTTSYDLTTGLPTETVDPNGTKTQMFYEDALLRPTRTLVTAADGTLGGETETVYGDTPGNLFVTAKTRIGTSGNASDWLAATKYLDGLGRETKTRTQDAAGDVLTETQYDVMGRVKKTSNPYRAGDALVWTENFYDAAGRLFKIRTPDGAETRKEFALQTAGENLGAVVTVTDASGKKARSVTNSLGQLVQVDEPGSANELPPVATATPTPTPTSTPTGGGTSCAAGNPEQCFGAAASGTESYPSYATTYQYNTAGQMVAVTQGAQKRFFLYDGMGRLIRVRQPEQEVNPAYDLADPVTGNSGWTARFVYDDSGRLIAAGDAKGMHTVSDYDTLNRPVRRCVTLASVSVTMQTRCANLSQQQLNANTPAVAYKYDNLPFGRGKAIEVTNGISTNRTLAFDALGRVTRAEQVTDGISYPFAYEYNLKGLTAEVYPSGRRTALEYAPDGDLQRVWGKPHVSSNPRTYADGFAYTAAGAVERMRLGNGLWETAQFNSRLQVTQLGLGTTATDDGLWRVNYDYGTLNADGTVDLTKNSGNIARQTITAPSVAPFVQTYRYDSLDRLVEAKEMQSGSQTWRQTFAYDRYGNRTGFSQWLAGGQTPLDNKLHPEIDAQTNRFKSGQNYTYDANGNLIKDAEGREFTFNGDNKQTIVKDGNGLIVGRYFYDGEGKRVKKQTFTGEVTIFVYSGGKLVAEYSTQQNPNPQISYTTSDHLNSPRVITDGQGQVTSRRDFLPFGTDAAISGGRSQANGYNSDTVRQKFTGYLKDEETNLEFAEARMYETRHGRFTAVDPLLASGKSANPQTFNRFVYVGNNPINVTDPLGLDWYKRTDANGIIHYDWYDSKTNSFTYDKDAKMSGDWTRIVGDAANYTYGTQNEGFVALDPLSSTFRTGLTSQAGAEKLVNTWSSSTAFSRGVILGNEESAGLNQRAPAAGKLAVGTAVAGGAIGTGVGGVMYATGTAVGGGITTLGLGGEVGGGAAAAEVSALSSASNSAFKAADNINSIFIKNKHMDFSFGVKNRFSTTDINQARNWVQEALRSPNATFRPNPNMPNSFRVITDLGRSIGTNGQTTIRIIIKDNVVKNAFPVRIQ